jgi:nitrite reductase (NO-forming)
MTPRAGRGARRGQGTRRSRRHLLVAGFVLGYLAAGGVVLALGDRVAMGGWLALHLVLLGAATNAIVVWSEHFAAALLRTAPVTERAATVRALALNLGIVAVLYGVPTGRTALAAAGAGLAGVVVLVHALTLAFRITGALPARLSGTVWFYVAAAAALLAGMGLGLWLAGGVAGSADEYLALRLAHVHLNVLGWVGLAVVGTQFTLWPTLLRTHLVPGLEAAARRSLPPLAAGVGVAAAGLALQQRAAALAGLAAYAAGADAAVMTSALLRNGPDHLRPLEVQVRDWMDRHGFETLDQLRGRLSQRSVPDPRAFERANYIRTLASHAGPGGGR